MAQWTFAGLEPGTYRVSATWNAHSNRATDSPFTVFDGSRALGTVRVNQELSPDDFSDAGAVWETLGEFTISGGTLVVQLSDDANEYVIADAIRIELVSRPVTSAYGAEGHLTSRTDELGRTTVWEYDGLGRRVHQTLPDPDGDPATGNPAPETFWTYNSLGELTKVLDHLGRGTDYEYNRRGLLKREILPDPDEPGTGQDRPETLRTYDAVGNVRTLTDALDRTTTYGYDFTHRLTSLTHDLAVSPDVAYTWQYDAASRITGMTSPDGGNTLSYDVAGQLTGSTLTSESYTYDGTGNRTNSGYVTDANNRLASDGTYSYQYDDEGNRTRKTAAAGDYVDYQWDHRNRLARVEFRTSGGALAKAVEYDYDTADRRIAKLVDENGDGSFERTERFVYTAGNVALEFDGAGSLTNRYLHGPDIDQLFADEDAVDGLLWALADHQQTVRDLADSTGTVVNHIEYDSFGEITGQSNAALTPLHAYTGQHWDADAQLYYYDARWYDPGVGRFVSEDPSGLGPDANLYRYVENSPWNYTDPTGRVLRNALDSVASAIPQAINALGQSVGSIGSSSSGSSGSPGLDGWSIYSGMAAPPGGGMQYLLDVIAGTQEYAARRSSERQWTEAEFLEAARRGEVLQKVPRRLSDYHPSEEMFRRHQERLAGANNAVKDAFGTAMYALELPVHGTAAALGTDKEGLIDGLTYLQHIGNEGAYYQHVRDRYGSDVARAGYDPKLDPNRFWTQLTVDVYSPSLPVGAALRYGDKAVDYAKGLRIKVDPNTLGMNLGNIRIERVPSGQVTLPILKNERFMPDGTRLLQNITNQANARLSADFSLGATVLRRDEMLGAATSPGVARMQYGNAVERLVARDIRGSAELSGFFRHVGGKSNPDFIGVGPYKGMQFDITTPGQVRSHLSRPYGPSLNIILYERPATFP